jgi:hypothetical protein
MNIGLLNLEPKYKNFALEKLRIYHQSKGDYAEDYFALNHYDKVYVSSIFTFTGKSIVPQGAVCGGSGFDLTTVLPPEVEDIQPHLNFGFTTRGCPNNCPFCIVRRKEGDIKIVSRLKDLWNGVKGALITLYDNNVLAVMEHFQEVCRDSVEYHVKLDFNQGLDHRKLTPEIVGVMKSISHVEYRFAFDSPAYYNSVERALKLLQDGGINRSLWYVLVGFNTTFQEDLDRVNFLRSRGQQAYIQRYQHHANDYKYIALAQWVNQHNIFYGMTWEQFLATDHSRRRGYAKLVLDNTVQ